MVMGVPAVAVTLRVTAVLLESLIPPLAWRLRFEPNVTVNVRVPVPLNGIVKLPLLSVYADPTFELTKMFGSVWLVRPLLGDVPRLSQARTLPLNAAMDATAGIGSASILKLPEVGALLVRSAAAAPRRESAGVSRGVVARGFSDHMGVAERAGVDLIDPLQHAAGTGVYVGLADDGVGCGSVVDLHLPRQHGGCDRGGFRVGPNHELGAVRLHAAWTVADQGGSGLRIEMLKRQRNRGFDSHAWRDVEVCGDGYCARTEHGHDAHTMQAHVGAAANHREAAELLFVDKNERLASAGSRSLLRTSKPRFLAVRGWSSRESSRKQSGCLQVIYRAGRDA